VTDTETEKMSALARRLGTELLFGAVLGQVTFTFANETDEDGHTPCSIAGDRSLPPAVTDALRAFLGIEATSWAHAMNDDFTECSCGWAGTRNESQQHMVEALRA